jgi:four helix bundle protein
MKEYGFEKLEIWNLGVNLVVRIYASTSAFPENERFGLTSQIRRAATSIPANIAEGNSRLGSKDKSRFIQIAYGSCIEVFNHILVAQKLGYISEQDLNQYRLDINELTNKINAFFKMSKEK